MAQTSTFKSSIHYQLCNSNLDNKIIKSSQINTDDDNDDLHEVTITSPINPTTLISPNHHLTSSTLSIASAHKQQTLSTNHHRPSIIGTLATTLSAVRKSSTSALALAQQRLSTDNGNLFSGYQGNRHKEREEENSIRAHNASTSFESLD